MVSSINVTDTSEDQRCSKFEDLIRMTWVSKRHINEKPSIISPHILLYTSNDIFYLFAEIFSETVLGSVTGSFDFELKLVE